MDAVRGREVRALEARVESLETERARLAEALRAATEAARVDDESSIGDSDTVALDDVAEKSPAAASAIRRERAKIAELAQRVRVLEATVEGERAGREREREEFKARSLGTSLSNSGLESDRPGAPSGSSAKPPPFASPRAVAAPSPVKAPPERTGSLDGAANRFEFSDGIAPNPEPSDVASGDTYRRILAEQRGERKVVRLEAELAKLRTHNEALRRQMRATQEASFEDVAVVPPSDPAEADAMRRAEDEAHRLGAGDAADDAAALLKAIDALRVAASRSTKGDGDGDGGGDIVAGAIAAAADAEAAAWRRARRRRRAATEDRARLRGETRAWRAALEDERAASRDAGRAWRKIKLDLETARDEAVELYRRERATGGVRASLAEEATELAREEARAARREAAEAFAARDAATGASAGALREARRGCQTPPPGVALGRAHRVPQGVEQGEQGARRARDAARGRSRQARRGRRGGPRRGARAPPRRRRGRGRVPRRGHQGDRGHDRGSRRRQGGVKRRRVWQSRRQGRGCGGVAQRDARQAPRQVRGSRRVGAQGEASRAEGGGGIGGARASAEARRERRRGARETLRRDVSEPTASLRGDGAGSGGAGEAEGGVGRQGRGVGRGRRARGEGPGAREDGVGWQGVARRGGGGGGGGREPQSTASPRRR